MKIVPVIPVQGEARADSRDIAKALGNQHKSVLALIGEYQTQFQAFGVLPFETAKPTGNLRGGRPVVYALLNEDQCYFLLTLVRNSEKVVELKLHLVQAFGRLRRLDAPAPLPLDLSALQRMADLIPVAIDSKVAQAKEEIRQEVSQEIDEKVGGLPATSEQRWEVKQLVGQIVGRRRELGLGRSHWANVYAEAWATCQVGSIDTMTRNQFPKVKAYLTAELTALGAMAKSGLFSEAQAVQS